MKVLRTLTLAGCGLLLLPACWGATAAMFDALAAAGTVGVLGGSFMAGVLAFFLCWFALPRPVRVYVLGHELTHALWGMIFGARPSQLRVGKNSGSVSLDKTNVFIVLSPYFFPFYVFVILAAAGLTACFVRPLPCLPAWVFAIGGAWAFHIVFTLQSLAQRQSDIERYGKALSWAVIYLFNIATITLAAAAAGPEGRCLSTVAAAARRTLASYASVAGWLWRTINASIA